MRVSPAFSTREDALQDLLSIDSRLAFEATHRTLQTLLDNLGKRQTHAGPCVGQPCVLEPCNAKFRRLRLSNTQIRKFVLPFPGAVWILEEAGFVANPEGDMLVFPQERDLLTVTASFQDLTRLPRRYQSKREVCLHAKGCAACKIPVLATITCKACRLPYCVRHRTEHGCEAKQEARRRRREHRRQVEEEGWGEESSEAPMADQEGTLRVPRRQSPDATSRKEEDAPRVPDRVAVPQPYASQAPDDCKRDQNEAKEEEEASSWQTQVAQEQANRAESNGSGQHQQRSGLCLRLWGGWGLQLVMGCFLAYLCCFTIGSFLFRGTLPG